MVVRAAEAVVVAAENLAIATELATAIPIERTLTVEAMESAITEPVAYKSVSAKATVNVVWAVEPRMRVIEVCPGPGADKDAAHKPLWPVITIRRASVRIGGIKAVFADWRRVVGITAINITAVIAAISWPDLYAK